MVVLLVVVRPDEKRMRQKEWQCGRRRRRTMNLASITTTDYDMAWALTWRVLCEEGPWAQEKMRYALPCASDDRFAASFQTMSDGSVLLSLAEETSRHFRSTQ